MSVVLFLLSFVGAALSVLGLYEYVAVKEGIEASLPFCTAGGSFDCAAVAASSYGTIFGIPLGSVGIIFYLWLAFFSLLAGSSALVDRRFAKGIFVLAGTVAAAFSIYLFIATKFFVGTMCPICLGVYAVNLLLFIAALVWAKGESLGALSGEALAGCWAGVKLLGQPGPVSQLIKATLLYLVVGIFLVRALPDFLVNSQLSPRAESNALFDEYRNAPVTALTVRRNVDALQGDYASPAENPKVEIVEYSDFECPACRAFHPVLQEILHDFPKDVRLTFKNFPLDMSCNKVMDRDLHKYACIAAETARCAGEQGKFWQTLEFLMTTPILEKENNSDIAESLAPGLREFGTDSEALTECLLSDRQMKKILSDIDEGIALDLPGTPAIFINGRQVTQITKDGLKELVKGLITGSVS